MLIKCNCGNYTPHRDEVKRDGVKQRMALNACVNCNYVPGLGDKIAKTLEKIPTFKKDCGCAERQQKLNEFGKRFTKK